MSRRLIWQIRLPDLRIQTLRSRGQRIHASAPSTFVMAATGEQIEMAPNLVPGDPNLLHRFALQTLWRWAVCPKSGIEQVDTVGFGPVIQRIRSWLLNPAGTLWTNHDVAANFRIADDHGLAVPPRGGWRAGVIVMTIGKFTFFIASRTRGLHGSLQANCLRAENGVRLLATTRMHNWIIDPMVDTLREGGWS
jgi:hypothetical protein